MLKDVCIVGLGAIGGWLAAHLARVEGLRVSALARGETLAA
ncbi:2-dehydropantoate 2-reductase N-terminal domain-containing protein, partial [Acinetobacter baumannii]